MGNTPHPFRGIETVCNNVDQWCADDVVVASLKGDEKSRHLFGKSAMEVAQLQALLLSHPKFQRVMTTTPSPKEHVVQRLRFSALQSNVPFSDKVLKETYLAASAVEAAQRVRHLLAKEATELERQVHPQEAAKEIPSWRKGLVASLRMGRVQNDLEHYRLILDKTVSKRPSNLGDPVTAALESVLGHHELQKMLIPPTIEAKLRVKNSRDLQGDFEETKAIRQEYVQATAPALGQTLTSKLDPKMKELLLMGIVSTQELFIMGYAGVLQELRRVEDEDLWK